MSLNPKLILPLALGVSIVSVTAFVVYYVFKKDEEDGDQKANKSVKTSRVNVIEINIPKSIVPALIGRSGSNIKEIERKSGALIHFKKFSDQDFDVCIVRGRSDASQLAETLIRDFIKQQPLIVEDTMDVPGWACGRIIGTGGESIIDISHRSGARVKIEGPAVSDRAAQRQVSFRGTKEQIAVAKGLIENCLRVHTKIEGPAVSDRAAQRQVSFRGTKEQIAVAKGLIENCVAQEKCRREIEQSKRSPRHSAPPEEPSDALGEPAHTHAKYKRAETSGASIEVYVSAVSSPSRFWVQFVGPQVAQLDELVAHMTEYYGDRDARENHKLKQVCVGQVVAAVFRHDGRWYRARVHDILPNEYDATKQVHISTLQPRTVSKTLQVCVGQVVAAVFRHDGRWYRARVHDILPNEYDATKQVHISTLQPRTVSNTLHLCVGQVVAAVFRHDGRWYRARVHDILPNEYDATKQVADVFYVDYGDSEYVAVEELCELRADLLRLRFQAMECFLAGVKPAGKEEDTVGVTAAGQRWDRWNPQAIERFEELTQVARWKPLVSRTCTYKKISTVEGEKEKEIPGIKLYDVTDEGELDIGGVLIEEGWAVAGEAVRAPPTPPAPRTPFGDLGNSRILSMVGGASPGRASSVPKDHTDDSAERDPRPPTDNTVIENERMASSKSHASGLEKSSPKAVSNFDLAYSDLKPKQVNGSQEDFLNSERSNDEKGSSDTLVPHTHIHQKTPRDEFKANINRIDSHHNSLEALGRQAELHK